MIPVVKYEAAGETRFSIRSAPACLSSGPVS